MAELYATYQITIKGGQLYIQDDVISKIDNDCLTKTDGDYLMSIKPIRNKRSEKQNRYYWGVIVKLLSNELGYTDSEMHEILKIKFNSQRHYNAKLNKDLPALPLTTTAFDTKSFSDYTEKIRQWAAMGGDDSTLSGETHDYDFSFPPIVIPEPNQVEWV